MCVKKKKYFAISILELSKSPVNPNLSATKPTPEPSFPYIAMVVATVLVSCFYFGVLLLFMDGAPEESSLTTQS